MLLHNTEYQLKIPMMPFGITPIIKVIPSVFQLLVAFSNKIVIYDTEKDRVIQSIELVIPEKKDLTKKSFQLDRVTSAHNISTPPPYYSSSRGLPLSHTAEVLPPPYHSAIESPPPYTAIESPPPYTAIALPSSLPCTVNNDLIVSVDTVFDAKTKKVFFLISDCNKVVHIFLYDLINPVTLEKKIELSKELNPNDKIVSVKISPNKKKLFVLYNGSPSGIKIIPFSLLSGLFSAVETRELAGIGYSELKVVDWGEVVALIVCVEYSLLDASASDRGEPGFFIYKDMLGTYYINRDCYSLFVFNAQLYEVVLRKKENDVNCPISISSYNKITYNDSDGFSVAGINLYNNEPPHLNIIKNDFLVIAAQEGLLLLDYENGLKIYLKPMNSHRQLLSSWIKIYENSVPLLISEPSVYKQADRDRSIILIKNTQSKFLVLDMKQILKEKESDISLLMLPKKDDVGGFSYGPTRDASSYNVSFFSASKK